MMIKAVTFDLWNTIFSEAHYGDRRVDILKRILVCEGFSIETDTLKTAYSSAMKLFELTWSANRRHVDAEEMIEHILAELGTRLPRKARRKAIDGFEAAILDDPPHLENGTEVVLKSLSSSHRIGLISNSGVTPGKILRKMLKSHKIYDYFQCTVFSDEVGYHKPHSAIFREALEALEVRAQEVIHVGDMLETDVAGAKAIGMKAVWLSMSKDSEDFNPQPDYRIEDLLQLRDIRELWK
ncbi:HAD family hydrolase [Candidatus Bathyarchaeota archaeon]|nr:HAD family hydrolase [Candidatus Bathyarchaeota archaeon]